MFTGIIEEVGIVKQIKKGLISSQISIGTEIILKCIKLGDSISTNGVCLTVCDIKTNSFTADIMAETLRRSNLGSLRVGDKVNLERALKLSDRFGGHVVTGHIDGRGKIVKLGKEGIAVWITIKPEEGLMKYIVKKGSIAIDGISFTVAETDIEEFKVSIIPYTGRETTLLTKTVGDEINIECDIIGKYVEKFLGLKESDDNEVENEMDCEFLRKNGFM